MNPASTHPLNASSPWPSAPAPASCLQTIAPGQAVWLYLEGGSTLYCQAGQLRIHSAWYYNLLLNAEDTPFCNGAHAGWYQIEALTLQPASLQITQPPQSLWHNMRRGLSEWLGL
jgi:hypothetical protein